MNIDYDWHFAQKKLPLDEGWLEQWEDLEPLKNDLNSPTKYQISCDLVFSWKVDEVTKALPKSPTLPQQTNKRWSRTSSGVYSPLKQHEIRVLHLEPGSCEDVLRGTFGVARLASDDCRDPKARFAALSYCWGATAACKDGILIDDTVIPIRQNLCSALQHLRHPRDVTVLWVDALCIDQSNISERNIQVQSMSSIFAEAELVHIWLGDSTRGSAVGMDVLKYFASCPRPTDDAPWLNMPPEQVKEGLADILSRDWFSRIWVVQEAVLAKRIVMRCGTSSFSWGVTRRAVETFVRMIRFACISPEWQARELDQPGSRLPASQARDLTRFLRELDQARIKLPTWLGDQISDSSYEKLSFEPLLQLLEMQLANLSRAEPVVSWPQMNIVDLAYEARDRKCSDPRDQLFGLIGLITRQGGRIDLIPDYDRTLTEVYQSMQELDNIWPCSCRDVAEHTANCHGR